MSLQEKVSGSAFVNFEYILGRLENPLETPATEIMWMLEAHQYLEDILKRSKTHKLSADDKTLFQFQEFLTSLLEKINNRMNYSKRTETYFNYGQLQKIDFSN